MLAAACSTPQKLPGGTLPEAKYAPSSGQTPNGAYGPAEPFGPIAPQVYGPDALQIKPIVLVLGPAMARGWVYIGVIRALSENKIPIAAIYSAEMGSLVGGLYAMDGNINHFEFGLIRYRPELFLEKSLWSDFMKKASSGEKLERELKKSFGDKDLKSTRIPLKIAVHSVNTDADLVLDSGCTWCAIRSSLAQPDYFTPSNSLGADMVASEKSGRNLVDQAKQLGVGAVVVVDMESFDVSGADIVIKPDLQGIKDSDFNRESDLAFRGKTATLSVMSEIKHQVGLPLP